MTTVHMTPPPLSPQSMADLLCTIVLLCRGKDIAGKNFWAYLCLKPSMAKAFAEAQLQASYNLEDFGTILEAGDGADVPLDIKARMKRDYGVNDNYEEEMLKALEQLKRRYSA